MMILKTSRSNLSSNDQLSLDLPFAATKSLTARVGPTPTFTRGSGATYIGSDGLIHGVDTSTTSNSISAASKTFTLAATAGQDQFWRAGDAVEASNGSNFMAGTVTSYDAATQSLVCNMTSIGGGGTFTSWRIGYRGPRFDHTSAGVCRGLLIEESRTNICRYSGELVNGTGWATVGMLSVGSGSGPDGNTAYEISEITGGTFHTFLNTGGTGSALVASITSGVTYAGSIFLKKITGSVDWVQVTLASGGFGASQYVNINISNGTIGNSSGGTARVEQYANGWYRVSWTATATTTTTTSGTLLVAGIQNTNGTTRVPSYSGVGTNKFLAAMAQFEVGSFPTSYIPTVASSVVRSADVCSITSSTLWNASEGTLLSKTIIPNGGFDCYTANWQNFFGHRRTNSNALSALIRGGGNFDLSLGTFVSGSLRVACTHGGNLVSAVANGGSINSTSGTLVLNPTVLGIGYSGSGSPINGPVDSIRYYRKRLSDAKLQALTA
jgi:hypothetical protein